MEYKLKGGQVGLLLLLIMGVVVALVMSVASRSLSDTVLSRQERESSAAFAVAESGVEAALNALQNRSGEQISGSLLDQSGFVSGSYLVSNLDTYALFLREGETAHLDLSGFSGSTINIAWTRVNDLSENVTTCAEGSQNAPAAIEVTAFVGGATTRSYFNPASCSPGANGFTTSNTGGSEYRSAISYSVPPAASALRIKTIYAGATVTASSTTTLQTQLYKIQSQATGGDSQKEIEVDRGLDAPPSIFDFAVFTSGTIVKN